MGMVVAARHLRLDQRVAIKVLKPECLARPELVERFAREARAAAKLKSDHVVRILDVDDQDDGAPFIVMEYLEGRDLAEIVKADGALPIARAVDYLLEACEALAEAHALGLIHRDLKPANLFVTTSADGEHVVKLLDFGISKMVDADDGDADLSLTHKTAVLGSPYYMSPEQLRSSKDVDARTDIWSLGVVLYQLLTAKLPFSGPTATALTARIAADPPAPLAEARPEVSADLERAVMRCLEKDPDKRFADVAKLARALAPFASSDAAVKTVDRLSRTLRAVSAFAATVPSSADPAPKPAESASGGRVTAALDEPELQKSGSSTQQGHSLAAAPSAPPAPVSRPASRAPLGVAAFVVVAGAVVWVSSRPPTKPAAPSAVPPESAATTLPARIEPSVTPPPPSAPLPAVDASVPTAARSVTPPRPDAPRRGPAATATSHTGLEVEIK